MQDNLTRAERAEGLIDLHGDQSSAAAILQCNDTQEDVDMIEAFRVLMAVWDAEDAAERTPLIHR